MGSPGWPSSAGRGKAIRPLLSSMGPLRCCTWLGSASRGEVPSTGQELLRDLAAHAAKQEGLALALTDRRAGGLRISEGGEHTPPAEWGLELPAALPQFL